MLQSLALAGARLKLKLLLPCVRLPLAACPPTTAACDPIRLAACLPITAACDPIRLAACPPPTQQLPEGGEAALRCKPYAVSPLSLLAPPSAPVTPAEFYQRWQALPHRAQARGGGAGAGRGGAGSSLLLVGMLLE